MSVDLIGDDDFIAKLDQKIEEGAEKLVVTVDPEGNIVGDTSQMDPHVLAQLQTPEAQAQIKDMYRSARYKKEPPRKPKYLNEGTQRFIAPVRPKGMTKAEAKAFRSAVRHKRHQIRKATIRSINHG